MKLSQAEKKNVELSLVNEKLIKRIKIANQFSCFTSTFEHEIRENYKKLYHLKWPIANSVSFF